MTMICLSDQFTIRDEAQQFRAALFARLLPLAREMLLDDRVKPASFETGQTFGVGFDEVRMCAEIRGWLPEKHCPSFGASLMKAAGGKPCELRPSKHRYGNRRLIRVFRYDPLR